MSKQYKLNHHAPRVFIQNWQKDIHELLTTTNSFMFQNNLDANSLIDEIIVIFKTSSMSLQLKLALLHAIQSLELFRNKQLVLSDLVNLLNQLLDEIIDNKDNLYVYQLLIALTTLSIELNEDFLKDGTSISVCVERQLNIISHTTADPRMSRVMLRATCCQCLNELQLFYPGLLTSKLGIIFQFCKVEKSFIRQHYIVLFTNVLRHALLFITNNIDESENCSNLFINLFTPDTELLPCAISTDYISYSVTPMDSAILGTMDKSELKQALSVVFEACPNMNPICMARTINLISDVLIICDLPPTVLRTILIKYVYSTNSSLLQMVYMLKFKFGRQLFEPQDESLFSRSIFWAINNPNNLKPFTLLYYDWLKSFPVLEPTTQLTLPGIPIEIPVTQLYYPTVYDSIDITIQCFEIYIQIDASRREKYPNITAHLEVLASKAQSQAHSVYSLALFRVFYILISKLQINELNDYICKLTTKLILHAPAIAPLAIEFFKSLLVLPNMENFTIPITCIVLDYLQKNPELELDKVLHYLSILEFSAQWTKFNVDILISYVQKLILNESIFEENSWHFGHFLLNVCRAILQSADTNIRFQNMCSILYHIQTKYEDVDVSDQANFLLLLITSVSREKYLPIISVRNQAEVDQPTLSDLVISSTFQLATPITYLSEILLQLERRYDTFTDKSAIYTSISNENQIAADYTNHIENNIENASFTLHYDLSFSPNAKITPSMHSLYAITIEVTGSPHYHATPITTVPVLTYPQDNGEQGKYDQAKVELSFKPKEPFPTTFNVSGTFTLKDGTTYHSPLSPLHIKFSDIFKPPPFPALISPELKIKLFDLLWKKLASRIFSSTNIESKSTESFITLNQTRENVSNAINKVLANNIISNSDDVIKILLFLPPSHHIFLKANLSDLSTNINILVSEWKLLPHINKFLQTLC